MIVFSFVHKNIKCGDVEKNTYREFLNEIASVNKLDYIIYQSIRSVNSIVFYKNAFIKKDRVVIMAARCSNVGQQLQILIWIEIN